MLSGLNEDAAFPILAARPKIRPGSEDHPWFRGKSVAVTGAGGSIGAEAVMQLAASSVAKIVLVDHSEYNLYEIMRTLEESGLKEIAYPYLADVRDRDALTRLFVSHGVDHVVHAAAYKHVPLLETKFNAMQGMRVNVNGTLNAVAAARAAGAGATIISTDKAVNPRSFMGLTKRLAELAVTHYARHAPVSVSIVRFGNVLGSSGSVVPLFRRQIQQGGPVTVTDPDMSRYFMSIKEAVGLTLTASAMALVRGAALPLFTLDMGPPVRIVDVARQLISQVGLRPDIDIKIEFTGLRPGEKLVEELAYPEESREVVAPGVFMADLDLSVPGSVDERVGSLMASIRADDFGATMRWASQLVPTYECGGDL